ncbi:Uncharacterised protein [Salmonella bongori]|nr:Uncharacterised protein [Salmonella bongori]
MILCSAMRFSHRQCRSVAFSGRPRFIPLFIFPMCSPGVSDIANSITYPPRRWGHRHGSPPRSSAPSQEHGRSALKRKGCRHYPPARELFDFRAFNRSAEALQALLLLDKARVGLIWGGRSLARKGTVLKRVNFGCPRTVLADGLSHIRAALSSFALTLSQIPACLPKGGMSLPLTEKNHLYPS